MLFPLGPACGGQASQTSFSPSYLILNVDTAPRVLPAPAPVSLPITNNSVGPHYSKGESLPHPVVLSLQLTHWEGVNRDFMFFQLEQDLQNGLR